MKNLATRGLKTNSFLRLTNFDIIQKSWTEALVYNNADNETFNIFKSGVVNRKTYHVRTFLGKLSEV